MAFLDKNGLQHLTNKLVQGDAIKVASHRGHTVSKVLENIQRECDNVSTPNTMSIENKVNNFKVGQGKTINVVGDVEQGKIDIELKGKTYQNLLKDKIDIIISDELKNSGRKFLHFTSKPNAPFTVILNLNYTGEKTQFFIRGYKGDNTFAEFGASSYITNYNGIIKILCNQDLELGCNSILIGVRNSKNGTIFSNVVVLEGDHTQIPIEELPNYFEKIKSSFEDGIVDVDIKGRNLFDNSKYILDKRGTGVTVTKLSNGHFKVVYSADNMQLDWGASTNFPHKEDRDGRLTIRVKKGDPIFISAKGGFNSIYVMERDINHNTVATKQYLDNKQVTYYATNNNVAYIEIAFASTVIKSSFELYDICIGYGICPKEYEPYHEKKYSFNITEPLRSLPNGVCDEIRNNNGQWELVRRIHKIILDGTNGITWSVADNVDSTGKYIVANSLESKGIPLINNKVGAYKFDNQIASSLVINNPYGFSNADCIWALEQEGMQIRFRISNIEQTSNGLNEWLKVNPVTFIYELETPIITPIDPIEFDIKPLSSIVINSDVVPESIHTVQLNRAAQIERGIIEIAELKKRVNTLEATYNSYFLENYHKLNLLNLEYEMERMIE